MGTTVHGYPYPEPADPINAGADNIKALALAVDARNGGFYSNQTTVTANNVSNAVQAVTFPVGRFTDTPQVVAQAHDTILWIAAVHNRTKTGFTQVIFTRTGAAASGTVVTTFLARQFFPG